MAAPVAPKPKLLPFHDPNFSWETFEGFFCDFLAGAPELVGKDGKSCRVVSAHPYGRRGDSQNGIDIRAEMSNGEVWVFQCKRYKEWGPKKISAAISKCSYQADRKYLLVTRPVSSETRDVIAKHPEWELWDSGDISREFLQRLPVAEAARILYANFGRGWPEELLGVSGSSPLVTAETKFAPLLELGRSFHHRLAMVGRRDWLQELDAFRGYLSSLFFALARSA
jgi:Restriction endonuclease